MEISILVEVTSGNIPSKQKSTTKRWTEMFTVKLTVEISIAHRSENLRSSSNFVTQNTFWVYWLTKNTNPTFHCHDHHHNILWNWHFIKVYQYPSQFQTWWVTGYGVKVSRNHQCLCYVWTEFPYHNKPFRYKYYYKVLTNGTSPLINIIHKMHPHLYSVHSKDERSMNYWQRH